MSGFHDTRFPVAIGFRAGRSIERRTEVVTLASGHEARNGLWAHSKRRFDVGTGVRSLDDLAEIAGFFEARSGRRFGFLFRDRLDWRSCAPSGAVAPNDQPLGTGDGAETVFPLTKRYGDAAGSYTREIAKPVAGSVRVAVNGVETAAFTLDAQARVVFDAAPASGAVLTAGFEFDTPVRFDTDALEIDEQAFAAGAAPSIPLIEVRL